MDTRPTLTKVLPLRVLVLDDNAYRLQCFSARYPTGVLATSAEQAIWYLERSGSTIWDLVTLDHDLGEGLSSGRAVTEWLAQHPHPIREIVIHSWNMPAAKDMLVDLLNAGYNVRCELFDPQGREPK